MSSVVPILVLKAQAIHHREHRGHRERLKSDKAFLVLLNFVTFVVRIVFCFFLGVRSLCVLGGELEFF